MTTQLYIASRRYGTLPRKWYVCTAKPQADDGNVYPCALNAPYLYCTDQAANAYGYARAIVREFETHPLGIRYELAA